MFDNWFFLALLAPAFWAVVVIIDDNLIRGVYKSPSVGVFIMGLFSLLPTLFLAFVPFVMPSLTVIGFSIFSGFTMGLAIWYYYKSLTLDTPSVVVAIWNMTYIFVPFLAYFLLNEKLNLFQYFGFIIVLLASVFLSFPNRKDFKINKVFPFMLIASALYAVSSIAQKYVYDFSEFWTGYIMISFGVFLAGVMFAVFSANARRFIKDYKTKYIKYTWIFIISESIYVIGVLLNSLAISKGPVSLVKVIEGIEPIYILLFAILFYPIVPNFLREAMTDGKFKKLILMGVMLIGLYFINF